MRYLETRATVLHDTADSVAVVMTREAFDGMIRHVQRMGHCLLCGEMMDMCFPCAAEALKNLGEIA